MRDIKRAFKRFLYSQFPFLQKFWIYINLKPKFAGWDMVTHAELPWNDRYCRDIDRFRKTNDDIKRQFEFGSDVNVNCDNIDGLLWRHYIVTFSVRYALKFCKSEQFNMVEAGVADGISAFFTLREVSETRRDKHYSMHLYDSWGAMRKKELLATEYESIGNFSELDINRTKRNLSEFHENILYHQGYVPESLDAPLLPPSSVNFMHIDINAAMPTRSLLDFFWSRLAGKAVILFDDYGWAAYKDMREMVDEYFADKSGILLKLPTGQAVYFHP